MVSVDFDHRAGVDQYFVIRLVSGREIGMIGVGHIGADQEAVRQGLFIAFRAGFQTKRYKQTLASG